MKLTAQRSELKTALALVRPAVMRGGKPALAGVLVDVTADGPARLTCTNIDTTISTTVTPTSLDGETGTVLVFHEQLANLAANATGDLVELHVDDDMLHFKAGRATARLRTLDASSFPQRQPLDKPDEAKLTDDWQAIQRVLPFRSSDVTRPILTGVHVNGDAGVVETTDSFRLARHDITVPCNLLLAPGAIVAAASVCPKGPVVLRWSTGRSSGGFEVEADGTVWTGHVIDGTFPPIDQLIPKDPALSLEVDRRELLAAIRFAASIGDEASVKDGKTSHTNTVRFTQSESDGQVSVMRVAQDVGDTDEPLEATVVGDCAYAFNAVYLVQLLGALTGDTVTLQGANGLKPWVAREGGFLGLQMPVKVS
jgi:DNA polymerase III sliding clamp (beta) subunit (PCNA family)